jgi:hypothetical protein
MMMAENKNEIEKKYDKVDGRKSSIMLNWRAKNRRNHDVENKIYDIER